jgi:hypothetical protein
VNIAIDLQADQLAGLETKNKTAERRAAVPSKDGKDESKAPTTRRVIKED